MQRKLIDMQAHFLPSSYIDRLMARGSSPYMERQGDKIFLQYGEKSFYTIGPLAYDLNRVIEELDMHKIDTQVLSINIPGAEILDLEQSIAIARDCNDEYADICAKYPDRFLAFATLPLRNTEASLKELERAKKLPGMKGMMFFSNVMGMHLGEERFWPVYEMAEQMDWPIYIHPTRPLIAPYVQGFNLETAVGYLFDTALAALRIIMHGVFEKYPNLKMIVPHAGSVLPYLYARIDYQTGLTPEFRKNISQEPSAYIKKFYVDTVIMHQPALKMACDLVGEEHVLFATDLPFVPVEASLALVRNLGISEEGQHNILAANAERLLHL